MLAVADNFARTGHLVYTYNMPATGIQPLATVMFAGIAYVINHMGGDRWTLIRATILFGSILFLLFGWLLASFAASLATSERRDLTFALAYLMLLFDFTIFRLVTYGLETGVYLVAIACCMIVWRRLVSRASNGNANWSDIVLLGVAGGFAGLARIDFGVLFLCLLASMLMRRLGTLLQVVTAGLIALTITSPWFLFVHSVSGFWLPSSGKAESSLITMHQLDRIQSWMLSLLCHLVPWSFAGARTLPTTIVGVTSLVGLIVVVVRSKNFRSKFRNLGEFSDTFAPWIVGIAVLSLIYLIFFWSTHFYPRYLSPMVIVSIPLLALVISESRLMQQRPVLIFAILAVLFCVWDIGSLHTGVMGNNHLISAGYIRSHFPDARVGAFQSGTIGYFNPNVENLDGKLNQGALSAAEKNQLPEFIDAEGINVLVDWPGYFKSKLPQEYLERVWEDCLEAMPVSDSICLIRKGWR